MKEKRVKDVWFEDDWRTCRVCKESDWTRSLFKYSARCYAHFHCYTKKHGFEKLLKALGPYRIWQLEKFPVLAADELGVFERIQKILKVEPKKGRKPLK